uniref:Uncharacterized protein n=1 Tax=Arundo donax TaxID=35708 RepID=A0A0A9DVI6_ARUDO
MSSSSPKLLSCMRSKRSLLLRKTQRKLLLCREPLTPSQLKWEGQPPESWTVTWEPAPQ